MSIGANGIETTGVNLFVGSNQVELTEIKCNGRTVYTSHVDLATASWEQIATISASGRASSMWNIGDTKQFALTSGEIIEVAIADFNHDDLSDGSGKAGVTFVMTHCMTAIAPMNSTATNVGGWGSCAMRTSTLPSYWDKIPSNLQSVIKEVNKLTSAGSLSSSIVTTADKIWLLSQAEIGAQVYSFNGEGTQYPIFTSDASRVRYAGYGGTTARGFWNRSPHKTDKTRFCSTTSAGAGAGLGANRTDRTDLSGICFAFCI